MTEGNSSLATGPIPYAKVFFAPAREFFGLGENLVHRGANLPVHEKVLVVDAGSASVHENFSRVVGEESIECVQEFCQESDDALHAGTRSR